VRNYWIATTRPDERPHATPVWGVWLDETFYFGTHRRSQKGRNLTTSPEIVVHLESGDDVVILEGIVEEVTDPSTRTKVGEDYDAKYGLDPTGEGGGEAVFYALRPRVAHSWLEHDFLETASRWRFGNS